MKDFFPIPKHHKLTYARALRKNNYEKEGNNKPEMEKELIKLKEDLHCFAST